MKNIEKRSIAYLAYSISDKMYAPELITTKRAIENPAWPSELTVPQTGSAARCATGPEDVGSRCHPKSIPWSANFES
jgi:hypothetical protein